MLQFLTEKLAEIATFIKAVVGVYAIAAIAMTWWKTRAWVPTLTSMLVAGTVMWGISNVSWFQNKVAEETRPHGMHDNPAVPRQMPRAPRLAAVGPTTVTPYSVRS